MLAGRPDGVRVEVFLALTLTGDPPSAEFNSLLRLVQTQSLLLICNMTVKASMLLGCFLCRPIDELVLWI